MADAWKVRTNVTKSFKQNYSFNLTTESLRDGRFQQRSKVTVTYPIPDSEEMLESSGTIQANGQLSGMAIFFARLDLPPMTEVEFDCQRSDGGAQIARIAAIQLPQSSTTEVPKPVSIEESSEKYVSVLSRLQANHIHFDRYKPEASNDWQPSGESDVYLAFGDLQEYTEFIYCCGVNTQLLRELGIYEKYRERSAEGIPDAIFLDRVTREYLIAEFKMKSSAFTSNHSADLIDVLVCWDDDEEQRDKLPKRIVNLRQKAREAGAEALAD